MKKLTRPIKVRNVNRSNNKGGLVTHKVKVNIYYKEHVEQVKYHEPPNSPKLIFIFIFIFILFYYVISLNQ